MMETTKIRQAGYPIRYTYKDFVDRFRFLGKQIQPSSKGDCKASSAKICKETFKGEHDYQLGHTKIFLKHQDNELLEELRSKILDKYIKTIQKAIKGWIYRRRYLKLRQAAITIQKHFRARGYRSRYLIIRNGYRRLQATIMSRQLTYFYAKIRKNIVNVQGLCRGYLVRHKHQFGLIYSIIKQRKSDEERLRKEGNRNYKVDAEKIMQQRLAECNREYVAKLKAIEEENKRAEKVIDEVFDFLPPNTPSIALENRVSTTVTFNTSLTIKFSE